MPNSSGTILDWVPQKAAQQMQSDATNRFMPQPRHAPPRRPSPHPPSSARRPAWASPAPPRAWGLPPSRGTRMRARRGRKMVPCLDGSNGSLGRDLMLRWAAARPALRAGGFRSPADVPGAEQKLLHLEILRDRREVLPRRDERIAEHGVPHQPEAERQNELAGRIRGDLAVHDDDASARTQLLPGVVEHAR